MSCASMKVADARAGRGVTNKRHNVAIVALGGTMSLAPM
jgi:hypothetical protein